MQLLGDVGLVESRSVHLEMVLVLMLHRYTVSTKCTMAQISFLTHPMELLGDIVMRTSTPTWEWLLQLNQHRHHQDHLLELVHVN